MIQRQKILKSLGWTLSRSTRRYDAVDIMKLWTLGSANGWNEFLTKSYETNNINALAKMRYSLQAGMDDLVKLKMNDEKMSVFYMRLLKSVEITAKKIIKKINPSIFDAPTLHGIKVKKEMPLSALEAKRKRDKDLELFFTNSSY